MSILISYLAQYESNDSTTTTTTTMNQIQYHQMPKLLKRVILTNIVYNTSMTPQTITSQSNYQSSERLSD